MKGIWWKHCCRWHMGLMYVWNFSKSKDCSCCWMPLRLKSKIVGINKKENRQGVNKCCAFLASVVHPVSVAVGDSHRQKFNDLMSSQTAWSSQSWILDLELPGLQLGDLGKIVWINFPTCDTELRYSTVSEWIFEDLLFYESLLPSIYNQCIMEGQDDPFCSEMWLHPS